MKKLFLLFSFFILLTLPFVSLAAENFITGIISRFISMIVWPVFIGLVVIMFMFAGGMFLLAQGEPEKINTAKKAVIYAVIGIIIAILGYSAYNIVNNIINPQNNGGEEAGGGGGITSGACCPTDGVSGCFIAGNAGGCAAFPGNYQGNGTTCNPDPC